MRRLTRVLSRSFINLMLLLGAFGLGLWVLGRIVGLSGRSSATAPIGAAAARYSRFATTGN